MARRALCIGINRFRDRDTPRLNGCVNDARSVAEVLSEQYGYGRDEVRLLLDDQATKASLLDSLDWLVSGARQGDQLVLFASTHGSHIPDADRDEADDEDEVLIAHDHDWDRSILVDDEIARHIARLPRGAVLATLWDACHSGTMNDLVRDAAATRARGVRRPLAATGYRPGISDVTGKYLPRPRGYVSRAPAEVHRVLPKSAAPASRGPTRATPPPAVDTLTLGACRDDETAADAKFDGRYAGAFTHGLLTALHESPDATWSQVFERLKREVRRGGFDQTPEIHGASALRDAPVFGGRASRARPVSSPSPAFDLAAHDRRIVQAETTEQWAEAARLLEERGARVSTDDERAYTYEHLVTLCRVKLHDERRAVAAAEKLLAAAPAHSDARQYLRAAYQSSGDVAKLRALDASQPREGSDLLGVLGAVASAVGQMMATPPAHGGAAKASPRAPSEARCGYCGATVSAGARQCPSCGAGA